MRVLGLMLTVTLLLSGCLPQQPPASPSPAPTVIPVFASEEEALAAAEAAYAEYLSVSDEVGSDGGRGSDRLAQLTTPEWFEEETRSWASIQESATHQVGLTALLSVELQQYSEEGEGRFTIAIYACVDFSDTVFVSASGEQTTPIDREPVALFVVSLEVLDGDPGHLLVDGSELWSSGQSCS